MLHDHPPGARRPSGLPEIPLIQDTGADIRPAVLVLVLSLRRDIFHVRGENTVAVTVHPFLGIGSAPDQPGDVCLPGERAVRRRFENQLQRSFRSFFRCEFPMMVVISEDDSVLAHPVGDLAKLATQGAPVGGIAFPLFRRRSGHEELVEAQGVTGLYDLVWALLTVAKLTWLDETLSPRASSLARTFSASSRWEPIVSTWP